jgi:hypothetical protein
VLVGEEVVRGVEEEVIEREKPVLAHAPKIAAVEEEVGGGSRRGGDGEGEARSCTCA